jgi:hypothetical protein
MKWHKQVILWLSLGLVFFGLARSLVSGATNAVPKKTQAITRPPGVGVKASWEIFPQPGLFIMSLARDGMNNLWVGTEGNGIWQYNPNAIAGRQWRQFKTKDGLGDDYGYSLVVDKQGRVWVGHLNHGVSVYNGTSWRNYDVPHGPIGERVFKISVCPTDGDVWIGTSAGLTRYGVGKDEWKNYTKGQNHLTRPAATLSPADSGGEGGGLPSDQISAIAFDKAGNIYVGTQCDGIAMASRDSDYTDWKQAPMADQVMPTFAGYGLPSKLINDLLVTSAGTIYAATDGGLAWSRDNGATWTFRRGKDFADKMRGLAGGPPRGWSAQSVPKDVPPEDYVTCLAEDDAGVIWADFRQHGLLALSGYGYEELAKMPTDKTGGADFGRAILPMPDFRPWLASYGKGLFRAAEPRRLLHKTVEKPELPEVAADAPFPTPAKPPTLAELTAMLQAVKKLEAEKSLPEWKTVPMAEAVKHWNPPATYSTNVAYLGEDWRTLGDWTGRYGRQHGILNSLASPMSHIVGWGWRITIDPHMGAHHADGDRLRNWISSSQLKTTDPRCPYSTVAGCRRIGEWDDHGEAYPMSYDGPDVWIAVGLPDGVFRVSVYFCDYNGHSNSERDRDYLLELKPYVTNAAAWDKQPTLAQCRVHDFWGGVYKSFIVTGAGKYHFKIGRNHSFNTMCNAVFVDRLVGPGFATADKSWLPYMEETRYNPPTVPPADPAHETPELLKARELWAALDTAYAVPNGVAMQDEFRLAAYQAALAANAPTNLLANWRWKMAWWTPEDRQEQHAILKTAYDKRTEMVKNHQPF